MSAVPPMSMPSEEELADREISNFTAILAHRDGLLEESVIRLVATLDGLPAERQRFRAKKSLWEILRAFLDQMP